MVSSITMRKLAKNLSESTFLEFWKIIKGESYDQPRQHMKSRDITLPTKVILGKKKIIKGIQTEKEEVKLSLFADHPKYSIKKLLDKK